jgi:hypothetical protein
MTTITVTDDDKRIRVNFPYDPDCVRIVKEVPSYCRSYDGATKTWTVDKEYEPGLIQEFLSAGHQIAGAVEPAGAPPPSADDFFGTGADAQAAEWVRAKAVEILADIPTELRGKVFREIAKALYPDLYRAIPR